MSDETLSFQVGRRSRAQHYLAELGEAAVAKDKAWEEEIRAFIGQCGLSDPLPDMAFDAFRAERDSLLGQFANNSDAAASR